LDSPDGTGLKIVLFANTDWYLYNFRLSLAEALNDAGHDVLLVSPPGQYGPMLESLGFRWQSIPMERRSLNPLREFSLLMHLRQLLHSEKPDIVHGFTIKSAVYGSLAARAAGIQRRVNAVAGMGYVFISNDLKARLLRPVVRALMRLALGGRCSRLVLQNHDDVALFKSARVVDPSVIRLIHGSGVDCSMFVPVSSDRSRCDEFRVLLASRLLWDKGIREYAEAARSLGKRDRPLRFLLAGDPDPGNPAAVPDAQLAEWQSEGIIACLGHVDDMAKLYASVDLVVLPSYREGLPKSLIEAAACGLPLVTTDVPGCREVVTNEVNGLIVPARDSGSLAAAIARIADDPDLASRLGRAARETAQQQFDVSIIVAQTLAVYDEILDPDS
jgi:glycosyltransferase involved in cell wall biosynthesis